MALPTSESATASPATDAPRLLIVADDLTGACDAAVAFTGHTDPVHVDLAGALPSGPGIAAISTSSRDLPPAEAHARLAALASHLSPATEVFKKIDSVFRGNTFAEILSAIELFPAALVILAPAYPAVGRRLHDGVLHIQHPSETQTLPIASTLLDRGCRLERIASGLLPDALAHKLRQALARGRKVFLCDATDQPHLEAVVQAVRSLQTRTLWIGSGGLAHALSSEAPSKPVATPSPPRPGHTVFFIGSDHPVTSEQVRYFQQKSTLKPTLCSSFDAISHHDLLLYVLRERTLKEHIQASLAHLDPLQTACLFMTGGDTALFVCHALQITSLRLTHEFAPGVPLGIAEGGPFHGTPVILKSGGFGEPHLISNIFNAFSRKADPLLQ
ncbi:MAG TPA: four-carbon acid sugar kinase family protein [Acidobacteriaceae bacterium]|nr:four-carbon acid sugar kinase family protein [Acidobacteriaceae bacterium]